MTKQHLSKRITLLSALALASVSLATTDLHTVHADEAVASAESTSGRTSLSPNLVTTVEEAEKKTITEKPEYTITSTVGTSNYGKVELHTDSQGNAAVSTEYQYFENAGDNYPELITDPNSTRRLPESFYKYDYDSATAPSDTSVPFYKFEKHLIVDLDKPKSYVNDPSSQTTEQVVYYKPRTEESRFIKKEKLEILKATYPVVETWYYKPKLSELVRFYLGKDDEVKRYSVAGAVDGDVEIFELLDKKSGDTTATNLEQYANKYRFVDYAIDHHDKKIIAKVIYFNDDKKVSDSPVVTNPATPTPQPTVPAPQPETDKAVKKEFTDPKTGIKVALGTGETIDAAGLKIQHIEPSSASVPQTLRHLDFDLFDIEVVDKEAKDLDITKPAIVTIPADAGKTVAEVVYLPNDTQKVTLAFTEKTVTIDGRQQKVVVFEAPHFSQYALVYKTKATSNTTTPTVTSTTATKPVKPVTSINQPNQATQTASVTSSLNADKPEVTLGNQKAAAKAEQAYQAPTALDQTDVSKAKTLPNTGSHTGLAMSLMGSFLVGAAAMVIKRQKN
ncbi:LPXTG cell wall anchor domain-containing protein [Streptococcus pluranimalium]|uniref:LPXTG cell wall anchor domain-containing protein n=1 Tax=Streptococcus pluranimalium TaxID=82348 RepID=UPI0039FBF416